jgi:hypothetical protein
MLKKERKMKEKNSKRIAVTTIAVAALLGISSMFAGISSAADPSATRSMPSSVGPGDSFTVTLTASGYGTFGEINETLPAGFTYVTSSLPAYQVTVWSGGVTFTLIGDTTFTYTVTAPVAAGDYVFSGVLKNEDKIAYTVGGNDTIMVGWTLWDYDTDHSGTIKKSEVIAAVMDYFADQITKDQVIQVVMLYFST